METERTRLYALLMQAPMPVAVFGGANLRYEVANAAYCEMVDCATSWTRASGRSFRSSASTRSSYRSSAPIDWASQSTFRDAHPHRARRRARRWRISTTWLNPSGDESDTVVAVMMVAIEITEQLLARRHVDNLRAVAEAASRAKDEFLSTLSHELRTPLNSIVGWSGLLRADAVPAEQQSKAIEAIERNARVQVRLIEDFLDLSRIEQGKMSSASAPSNWCAS